MDRDDKAWNDLEEAIHTFLERTGEDGLLMDWVLVTHVLNQAHDDGTNTMSTSVTGMQHQPTYRAIGLLEYGLAATRAGALGGLGEDD